MDLNPIPETNRLGDDNDCMGICISKPLTTARATISHLANALPGRRPKPNPLDLKEIRQNILSRIESPAVVLNVYANVGKTFRDDVNEKICHDFYGAQNIPIRLPRCDVSGKVVDWKDLLKEKIKIAKVAYRVNYTHGYTEEAKVQDSERLSAIEFG